MKEILHIVQGWIMLACLLSLAVVGLMSVSPKLVRNLRRLLTHRGVAALAVGLALFGGAKHVSVLFPRTDPTTAYLIDNGSYVDSDTDIVHIDFRRIIVPDSARIYVDRIQDGDESGIWTTEYESTFADLVLPLEIHIANATNYRWMVYTDWTPGPAVQTNGVWHANWALDRRARRYIIPLRTAVRVDGATIATPKSKEDSTHE